MFFYAWLTVGSIDSSPVEISKSFEIYRRFVTFYLWPDDQGFEHQRSTAYINNKFETSFPKFQWNYLLEKLYHVVF